MTSSKASATQVPNTLDQPRRHSRWLTNLAVAGLLVQMIVPLLVFPAAASAQDAPPPTETTQEAEAPSPDTAAPVLGVPSDFIVLAEPGAGSAVVSFEVTANDAVDGPLAPTCSRASGSSFPLGDTIVACTATDAAGNQGSGQFTVTVAPAPAPTATSVPLPTNTPTPPEPVPPTPTEPPAATSTPQATAGPPSIVSDKADYAPGELVTLTGANWAPGETVNIYVNDDWGSTWSRNVDVTADAEGKIVDQFNLPDWFVATYSVRATGSISGSATTSFTDGNLKVGSNSERHFNYTATLYTGSADCTGTSGAADSKTADTNGSTTGVGHNQSLLIVANLYANAPNASAVFVSWSTPGDTPVEFAAGYSATDRTVCVIGFQEGSRDLIGIYAVNTAPVANNQSVTTNEDVAAEITLTASDADGNTLTYSIVSGPANGTLTGTGANRTYTPNANYNGSDSFTFKANDGTVDSNTATVSITVTAVNDAPVANDQSVTTSEDVAAEITLTASDADGNTLTYSIVSGPAYGTLSGTAPSLTYTPTANFNGSDSFTFKANDGAA
ncbi:MAG: Ig-like domain-containing protein, partial [Chloroflexota bacterium]|nr:Ig-like domain-containing protein [Chloroflexota bacterium]